MTNNDDYALWAQIANAAAQKTVRPELIQVDDADFQDALNDLATRKLTEEAERTKDVLLLDTQHFFGRPVLGKILILPRSGAREFVYEKPWACISIADEKAEFPKINQVQLVDCLQLTFMDLEVMPSERFLERYPEKNNLFVAEQGEKIWNFVAKWWNDIDLLMIHCYAGISRSSAVGKAISEVYQPEFVDYFDKLFSPNKLVHEILRETNA